MPFTAPVTRATDFLVTAAIWNAEHVDNFNTAVMHLMVRKTADESVVSSTVQQNDDVLFFAVAANEIWRFELMLITTGTFDFAGQMTFPSGRIDGSAIATSGAGTIALTNLGSNSSPSLQWVARCDSTTVPRTHSVYGIFANGGSAGNLQLQWAQGTSGATATIVKANSTLWAVRLA